MKVAHINCVYEIGSTGKLIGEIVDACSKLGIESRVFYSEGKSTRNEAIRYIKDYERTIHAVLSRISGLQGYWSKCATKRLIQYLQDYKPDVIHIHTLHGNCINLRLFFSYIKKNNIPIVLTLHDCWWFTGRCAHPIVYKCEKWEKKQVEHCYACPAQKDVCPSWFFDHAGIMIDDKKKLLEDIDSLHVVCVSDWLKKQVLESYVFENVQKIDRIYNWIDVDTFHLTQKNKILNKIPGGEKVILGVASTFTESKGLLDFLWLSEHLSDEYRIVLVGSIKNYKTLPNNIIHIENTSNKEELVSLYNHADVFVNPSKCETFGLTTVEAMACGTPVVLYEFTTSKEIVGENCGKIVPLGDREQLLKAIIDVCNQKKESFSCIEWVTEKFSKKNGVTEYVEIYQRTQEKKFKHAL